jgi:hypothetical protein
MCFTLFFNTQIEISPHLMQTKIIDSLKKNRMINTKTNTKKKPHSHWQIATLSWNKGRDHTRRKKHRSTYLIKFLQVTKSWLFQEYSLNSWLQLCPCVLLKICRQSWFSFTKKIKSVKGETYLAQNFITICNSRI